MTGVGPEELLNQKIKKALDEILGKNISIKGRRGGVDGRGEGGSSCCEWVCSHRSYFLSLQDFSHSEGVRIQISGNVDFSHRLDWTSSACKVDMSTKTNFPLPLEFWFQLKL